MKNQYFGDVNDYRKYGLLRLLSGCRQPQAAARCQEVKTAVCWMLSRDDSGRDGGHIQYLKEPQKWRRFDPELYQFLHEQVIQRRIRRVGALEGTNMLAACRFYTKDLNERSDREEYFREFLQLARGSKLVFFDPDNGIEVPSVPFGRTRSCKYLYWREVETCFSSGHSLLVYQHFPRRPRDEFISTRAAEFRARMGVNYVHSCRTSSVVFFLVPQPAHEALFAHVHDEVAKTWEGQIEVSEHSGRGNPA